MGRHNDGAPAGVCQAFRLNPEFWREACTALGTLSTERGRVNGLEPLRLCHEVGASIHDCCQ